MWTFYYPAHTEIQDPTPELPQTLIGKINAIIIRTVAYLRTTDDTELKRAEQLGEAAVEVFGLLSQGRVEEAQADVNSLRQALHSDAEGALKAAHWAYKQAHNGGRMPYFEWHEGIERRLYDAAAQIETNWWTRLADANPTSPISPPPIPTRTPRTETAFRIEAFLDRVQKDAKIKVDKMDFWLRPLKDNGDPRYSSDREFRSFQKEDPGLSPGVVRIFNAVFRLPPEKFVEGREQRRQWLRAKRKKKIRR